MLLASLLAFPLMLFGGWHLNQQRMKARSFGEMDVTAPTLDVRFQAVAGRILGVTAREIIATPGARLMPLITARDEHDPNPSTFVEGSFGTQSSGEIIALPETEFGLMTIYVCAADASGNRTNRIFEIIWRNEE